MDRTISTYANLVIKPSRDRILQALDQPHGNRVMCSLEYIHFHEFVIYMLDTLMNIDAVSSDFELNMPGTCGKNGQGMFVNDGGPYVRVRQLVVGGQRRV